MLSSLRAGPRFLRCSRVCSKSLRWYSSEKNSSALGLLDDEPKFKPFNPALRELKDDNEDAQNDGPLHEASVGPFVQSGRLEQDKLRISRAPAKPGKAAMTAEEVLALETEELVTTPFKRARAAPGNRLLYRHVLVTGGSSGIGYAVAKRCVEEGATSVAILSRSSVNADQAIARIKRETGLGDAPVYSVIGDLNDFNSLIRGDRELLSKGLHYQYWERFGWNTLINSAGMGQSRLLISTSPEEVSSLLRVNLEAPIAMSKFVMGKWTARLSTQKGQEAAQEHGLSPCIVNVSSLLAIKGGMGASIYAASKAGLLAFSRALALEAAQSKKKHPRSPPMRINTILPGFIETPMTGAIIGEAREKLNDEIPLHRFGTPDEVADAVVFLVSNEYANNCVLNLDGGLSAT